MGSLDQVLGSVLGNDGAVTPGRAPGPEEQAPSILAQLLPVLVDRLTPHGQVPEQSQLGQSSADLLRSLLAGRAG